MTLFRRLSLVSHFTTQQQHNGLLTQGSGQVVVSHVSKSVLIFNEHGRRQIEGGAYVDFTNVYRWQLLANGVLSLSHLRRGLDHAVHLLDFESREEGIWQTIHPHYCGNDIYHATLRVQAQHLHLQWCIQGNKKFIVINVFYR